MAANAPSNDPLDPDDELTRPEARPGLRGGHVAVEPPPGLLGPATPPADPAATEADADADENADAVTLVDPGRRRLVNVETLPPPDFPDLD